MRDIMLDIETLDTTPTAAVVSIGAVGFDPATGVIHPNRFHVLIELEDAARFGSISAATIAWWLKQSDAARAGVTGGDRTTTGPALAALAAWMDIVTPIGYRDRRVWGNGATFDNTILRGKYEAAPHLGCPWPFWGDRDVRTVVDIGQRVRGVDPKRDTPFVGVAHNALADAEHQAKYVSAIIRALAAGETT